MKLAFTTLGCPQWDLATIVKRAVEYGFDGVDFRGYLGRIPLPEIPEFTARAAESAALVRAAGLEVPCLSSSAGIAGDPQAALDEIAAYAPICQAFGAPLLRVFGGGDFAEEDRNHAAVRAILTLREAAEIAAHYDFTVVLETHDRWVAGTSLRPIMEAVDSPRVGILWDVHHPYRIAGESPSATWDAVGPWVKYTHVKDSRLDPANPDGHQLCLTGEGDIPLPEIMRVLQAGGYDGWLTLEWEKHWHPEIEEPEVAFPQYVRYMRELINDK
jgi:sugar phosphate isomerase/epimerase